LSREEGKGGRSRDDFDLLRRTPGEERREEARKEGMPSIKKKIFRKIARGDQLRTFPQIVEPLRGEKKEEKCENEVLIRISQRGGGGELASNKKPFPPT